MRSKAPLLLMEQMVMLLVFALAAALCVQAFVKSDEMSGRCEARDQAVILVQSVAEQLCSAGGDAETALASVSEELSEAVFFEDGTLRMIFDEEWEPVPENWRELKLPEPVQESYFLEARALPAETGLSRASVAVTTGSETLFAVEIAWQSPLT